MPGAALQTYTFVINSLTHCSFDKISLRRGHALMVEDGAFSHKIVYVRFFRRFLIQIALLVQKLRQFSKWVDLHWEGSAPAACAAGLFKMRKHLRMR